MAGSPSPTVRRRRLGMELRRLREKAGLTCDEVGERLECSGSRISRIETGRVGVRTGDVAELLDLYGVTGEQERATMLTIAREARRKGWWHSYGDVLPAWFETYVGMESAASTLRTYHSLLVPGLLQTEDYARALLHLEPGLADVEQGERKVALRMARQAVLSGPNPPQLWVVLSEAVLRLRVGSPVIMRDQLHRLIKVGELPHVTIQVLPFDVSAHARAPGPFTVLEFPEAGDPQVVYVEYGTGSFFLERDDEVRWHTITFDHLRADALGSCQSAELIADVADGGK